MNPCAPIDDLVERGVKITAQGGQLLLRGPKETISPELVQILRVHKAQILPVLAAIDPKIEGVSVEELKRLFADDWLDLEAHPKSLSARAKACREGKQIAQGEIPAEFTARVICIHCGEVWMPPNSLNPRNGCPSCFNRLAGRPIPQPRLK